MDIKKRQFLQRALLIVLLAAVAVGGFFLASSLGVDRMFSQQSTGTAPASSTAGEIHITVLGAVNSPGTYTLQRGSVVMNAVKKAGGFTADADADVQNVLTPLEDGAVLLVPRKAK